MKSIKTIDIPKCPKCKELMEVGFTTEKEKEDDEKAKVIICFGTCEKCKVRLVFDLIEVDELPSNPKELMEAIEKEKLSQKNKKARADK